MIEAHKANFKKAFAINIEAYFIRQITTNSRKFASKFVSWKLEIDQALFNGTQTTLPMLQRNCAY